jgi:carbon-monoxide dehydrogenase medium subunit/2-furoyl-CoA dehydrogenase FAD binding subunit
MAGVAAVAGVDEAGKCETARLVFFSIGDVPEDSGDALSGLIGSKGSEELIDAAVEKAVEQLEPSDDIHATAEYRMHLARVLGKRALIRAFERAGKVS